MLYTRVYFVFDVHKLAKVSSNPGKEHFAGLVHCFRYIRDNKNLGLKYYNYMTDAPLYYLLRQSDIKNENQLMGFSDKSGNIVQIMAEVQEHTLYSNKVVQLTMAHMFQD